MKDTTNIKKIIVFLPNWIGDAVLSLPAIYRIRELFPSAQIAVTGLPHITELFKEYPYIDKIIVHPVKNQKADLLPAANELRRFKFDLAILFPNSLRSAIIARLAGIPLRCGYNRDGRRLVLNIPVNINPEVKKLHQSQYYLNLLNSLDSYFNLSKALSGKDMTDDILKSFKLDISKDEERKAIEILNRNNIAPDDLLIGINPGAAYGSSKRWYPERYGNVARTLIKQ